MENCPHYLAIWLGLTPASASPSHSSTPTLPGEALAHSINTVAPRYVIVGAQLAAAVQRACARDLRRRWSAGCSGGERRGVCRGWICDRSRCSARSRSSRRAIPGAHAQRARAVHLYLRHHGPAQGGQRQSLPPHAVEPLVRRPHGCHARATACTTACRCITASAAWWRPGPLLVSGGAVVLRERFSASGFWARRRRRALHAVPVHRRAVPLPAGQLRRSPHEAQHRLRLACGNGLRADVWVPFQAALPDTADPRVLRRHRGQLLALQLRGASRRDRAHPAVSRAPHAGRARASSTWTRAAPARDANGPLHALRVPMKSVRPSDRSSVSRGATRFEGYTDADGLEPQGAARRVHAPGMPGTAPAI